MDRVREQKKLWNIRETMIPVVVCPLGTISKALEIFKKSDGIRNKKNNREHTDHIISKIG